MTSETFPTQQTEAEKIESTETKESPEVVATPEISNEQLQEHATNAVANIEKQAAEISTGAEMSIESASKNVGASPDTINTVRAEQQVDSQMSELHAEASKLSDEAKSEIETIVQEDGMPTVNQEADVEGMDGLKTKEKEIGNILEKNKDIEYEKIIEDIKKEKSEWVLSAEFARRIQLTGASSEDVEQIREWVLGNLKNGKVHVFEKTDLVALKEKLVEYSKLESGTDEARFEQGKAFYVNGNSKHLPESVLNNVHVPESTFEPNVYPVEVSTEGLLSHEMGHQAQDGLLESELYKDWKPTMKADAPDPEYIGNIVETDTRIRAMFRQIKDTYDPTVVQFGEAQLAQIREKQKQGLLEKDTLDLLDHYDDNELIRIANILPAI